MSSISGMNTSKKNNESLRTSKRKKFKSNNREGIYSKEKEDTLEFNEVSEEELYLIKKQIHENLKKQKRKQLGMLFLSVVIFIILIQIILY